MKPILLIVIFALVGIGIAILAGIVTERKLRQNAKDDPTKKIKRLKY